MVRATGRLPLQVFSDDGFPSSLESCLLYGAVSVAIRHIVAERPATYHLYAAWWSSSGRPGKPPNRTNWHHLRMELFAGRVRYLTSSPGEGASRIQYVGSACKLLVDARRTDNLDRSVGQLLKKIFLHIFT